MNLIRNRLTPMINKTIFRALLIRVSFAVAGASFPNIDATWQPIPVNNPWSTSHE